MPQIIYVSYFSANLSESITKILDIVSKRYVYHSVKAQKFVVCYRRDCKQMKNKSKQTVPFVTDVCIWSQGDLNSLSGKSNNQWLSAYFRNNNNRNSLNHKICFKPGLYTRIIQ